VYLPLSTSTPIFVGGLVRWLVDRWNRLRDRRPVSESESEMSSGVLFSTGYIAGGTIGGVVIAFLSFSETVTKRMAAVGDWFGGDKNNALALATFGALVVLLLCAGAGWWEKRKHV
jgi:hypothetical protein